MSDTWMRAPGLLYPAPPPARSGRGDRGAHATRPFRGGGPAPRANPSPPAAAPPAPSRPRALRRHLKSSPPGCRSPATSSLRRRAATKRWAGTGPVVLSASHARATQRRDSQSIPSRALQSAPRHAAAPPVSPRSRGRNPQVGFRVTPTGADYPRRV